MLLALIGSANLTMVVLLFTLVILIHMGGEGVSSFLEDSMTCPHLQCAIAEAHAGGCLRGHHRSLDANLEVATQLHSRARGELLGS
jgi:hypothetical protein